ncbi:MAG: diguanylate cyclase domain-containing protein, partial [Alphaproteobacteria bacterium]
MLKRVIFAALAFAIAFAAEASGLLKPLDDRLGAMRMAAWERAPTGDVVLVDIDTKSIAALQTWPWPRRLHAEMIDRLMALGAAEIAFDIDFSAVSNAQDDALLEAALERAGGSIILAAFSQQQTARREDGVAFNQPLARLARHAWLTSVNVHQDSDGIVRRYPYGANIAGAFVPSNPVMLSGGIGQGTTEFIVDFSIAAGAVDRFSYVDVLNGSVGADQLAGKQVIIGAQAAELRDFFNVPGGRIMSGALLQVIATETLLQDRALTQTGLPITVLGLLALLLSAFALRRLRWSHALGVLALVALTTEGVAILAQATHGVVVLTAAWHVAVFVLAAAVLLHEIDFQRLGQLVFQLRAKNAEEMLSRVVKDNFAGIVVIGDDGRIHAASQVACELLSKDVDVRGHAAREVVPRALLRKVEAAFGADDAQGREDRGEVLLKRPDGKVRILDYVVTLSEQTDLDEGEQHEEAHSVACLTFSDVTEKRTSEAKIERMARFDTLTALPNRNQFIEHLEEAAVRVLDGHTACAVMCFDLDGFKNVNDSLGHGIGDRLLAGVAARASRLMPPNALVARLGGDEFAVIVEDKDANKLIASAAACLIDSLSEPFEIGGHRVVVAASAGLAKVGPSAPNADDVIKHADVALYRAKNSGGNCVVRFEREMLSSIAERQRLELDLWQAFDKDQFEVWYQPQVDMRTTDICGVEALLRWHHPQRGMVSPTEFIPVAESIGLIERLGRWVLETACRDAASWSQPIKLAVNVSSDQFSR